MLSQGKFKEMEEYEFEVDDKKTAEGMYEVLGLKLHQSIKKYRESYQLEDGLVEIDINDTTFCPFSIYRNRNWLRRKVRKNS